MKMNTIEKLYLCLKNEKPEIKLSEDILKLAEIPIRKMLEISRKMNLVK
jgi:quinolinate synthase